MDMQLLTDRSMSSCHTCTGCRAGSSRRCWRGRGSRRACWKAEGGNWARSGSGRGRCGNGSVHRRLPCNRRRRWSAHTCTQHAPHTSGIFHPGHARQWRRGAWRRFPDRIRKTGLGLPKEELALHFKRTWAHLSRLQGMPAVALVAAGAGVLPSYMYGSPANITKPYQNTMNIYHKKLITAIVSLTKTY